MDVRARYGHCLFGRGLSPIPMQMARTEHYRGPRRWVCQSAHCRTHRSQIRKRNSLPNLDFLAPSDTVRLRHNQKQHQKITITIAKTNNLGSPLSSKGRTKRYHRSFRSCEMTRAAACTLRLDRRHRSKGDYGGSRLLGSRPGKVSFGTYCPSASSAL
jgi:hypothetical protein